MMFKQEHPDRDIQDTVYINAPEPVVQKNILERVKQVYESGFKTARNNKSIGYARKFDDKKSRVLIMRGHTTATTFRYINEFISKNKDSPAKYFSLSKVFRNETMDQTHLPEFYQVEGIVYDDNLNVSHLIGYIKEFYGRIGMDQIRLKPTYNPYTEPSLEIQAFSSKLNKWIEVGNSGVFRPETLEPFGIKKNIVAWGFGFDRILLLKLGLADVRLLYGGFADLDVLRNVEARKLFDRMG
jgi:phenylalanyl-tRNA synthetase alpha chain